MGKTLIVYFSFSGNTRAVAKTIAMQIAGEILEIVPHKTYSFDYNTAAKEARSEIARDYCPELLTGKESIDAYDKVFVGTPNWFKSMAPPVLAFLRIHNFCGKTVVPFCSHGGGGFGEIEGRIAEECPGAIMLEGLAASPDITEEQIALWLTRIGCLS